jgi:hypothetical protein
MPFCEGPARRRCGVEDAGYALSAPEALAIRKLGESSSVKGFANLHLAGIVIKGAQVVCQDGNAVGQAYLS